MSSSNEKTSNVYKVLNTLCKAGNVLFICSLLLREFYIHDFLMMKNSS